MSIVVSFFTALLIFWLFASNNFAINMTILAVVFAAMEVVNKRVTGSTISGNFWDWLKTAKRWKAYLVASVFIVLGVVVFFHLMFRF